MTITVTARPYNVYTDTGAAWLAPSHVAQELINAGDVVRATRGRVVLQDGPTRLVIVPATLGGGPAFLLSK